MCFHVNGLGVYRAQLIMVTMANIESLLYIGDPLGWITPVWNLQSHATNKNSTLILHIDSSARCLNRRCWFGLRRPIIRCSVSYFTLFMPNIAGNINTTFLDQAYFQPRPSWPGSDMCPSIKCTRQSFDRCHFDRWCTTSQKNTCPTFLINSNLAWESPCMTLKADSNALIFP